MTEPRPNDLSSPSDDELFSEWAPCSPLLDVTSSLLLDVTRSPLLNVTSSPLLAFKHGNEPLPLI